MRKLIAIMAAAALAAAVLAAPVQAGPNKKKSQAKPAEVAANDDFARAEDIARVPYAKVVDNTNATVEAGEPQDCGLTDRTVWFSFTPDANTELVARALSESFDATLAVYVGDSVGALERIGCLAGATDVAFYAERNVTYRFQVGGSSGGAGAINFELARGNTPTPLVGQPGSLPHGWAEEELLPPKTVEHQSDGTDLIRVDGRPNALDPQMYDLDIRVAGNQLPRLSLWTQGRLKDEIHFGVLGPSRTSATVGMKVRFDTRGQQCVVGVDNKCQLLLPNLPTADDILSGKAIKAELIVTVVVERQAGIAAIPRTQQVVRVPLVGYAAAILP